MGHLAPVILCAVVATYLASHFLIFCPMLPFKRILPKSSWPVRTHWPVKGAQWPVNRAIIPRNYSSNVEELKLETSTNDADLSAETTGVMDFSKLTEVLMFFDNVYPRWVAKLSFRKYFGLLNFFQSSTEKLEANVCELAESVQLPLPEGTKVMEFVPLKRDGGAFVKFLVPPTSSVKELTNTIEKNIQLNKKLADERWFGPLLLRRHPRAYQVKGTPWIEDLSRFPSLKLKVLFGGEQLTEEELYLLFRRYGMISDIIPPSSTVSYATIVFKTTDACIRAKNCVTGIKLNNDKTTLHLQYIPMQRVNYLADFVLNHQRIAIPIILALLATIAVVIFEPIREQFIEIKIKHKYSWDAQKDHWLVKTFNIPYRTVMSWVNDSRSFLDGSFGGRRLDEMDVPEVGSDMFWTERSEKANQVRLWVCENANTFIIVKGPKGSGKREFIVDHALKINADLGKLVLELDCDPLVKSRSDSTFLKTAAGQLGYFPLFTWTNSISLFVDLGLQGLTGQKSGLSETKETQFKNMLLLTQVAIRRVALADFAAYKCEYETQQRRKLQEHGEDTLETRIAEVKEEDYLQLHPEVKPVIVINNFLRRSDGNDFIYKSFADWAAQLIQSNTAHVVFITLDLGSVQHLTNALPNQVFKTVSLADASPLSAKQYVMNQLQNETRGPTIEKVLEPIGGRMLDLQAFVRRVKSGEALDDALNEMVNQAAEQITTFFLNITTANLLSDIDATWSTAQIWALMRLLAKLETIEFDDLVKSPFFESNYETVATLSALEKNDLVTLHRDKGIVNTISTGRPLYKAAFESLVNDVKVFKLYETHFYKSLISIENARIAKMEDEVAKLGQLNDPKIMRERLEYVFTKINLSTGKVQTYEAKIKEIDKIGSEVKKSFLGF